VPLFVVLFLFCPPTTNHNHASSVTALPLLLQDTSIPVTSVLRERRQEAQPYACGKAHTEKLKYAESDFNSAITKLTEGAVQYDRSTVTTEKLEDIHDAIMPLNISKVLHGSNSVHVCH
jgi:hypothetical protein